MRKPSLIVVTGRPGSGKTTLARALATAIHCPLFSRDEFKEGFVRAAGSSHAELGPEVNSEIYETFFQAVEWMLAKGISLIAEAAFQHSVWFPKLEPLRGVSELFVVICCVDSRVASERFIARGLADPDRQRFHGDRVDGSGLPSAGYEPPKLAVPTLRVDTSDGYDPPIEEIAAFLTRRPSEALEGGR